MCRKTNKISNDRIKCFTIVKAHMNIRFAVFYLEIQLIRLPGQKSDVGSENSFLCYQ